MAMTAALMLELAWIRTLGIRKERRDARLSDGDSKLCLLLFPRNPRKFKSPL